MEQPKLTDKRLVRYLMNKKNIEGIDIRKQVIIVYFVKDKITPKGLLEMVRAIGHKEFEPVKTDNGSLGAILHRY